jgi:hypothetical protein
MRGGANNFLGMIVWSFIKSSYLQAGQPAVGVTERCQIVRDMRPD